MQHLTFITHRSAWRQPLIVSLALAWLLALLFFVHHATAADHTAAPTKLGSLSGLVTNQAGAPLANINVTAKFAGGFYTTTTDAAGAYQLMGLFTSLYHLRFEDPQAHYAIQWYAQSATEAQAADVAVAGNNVTGVNVSLTPGGRLTGTVSFPRQVLFSGDAIIYTHQEGQWQLADDRPLALTGQYTSHVLLPGVYHLCGDGYVIGIGTLFSCYGGNDLDHTANITVTAGETQTNLDINLAEGSYEAELSGLVTAEGTARAGIKVTLYTGYYSDSPAYFSSVVYVFTDASGHYRIGGLRNSKYVVGFSDPTGTYATTFFENERVQSQATVIPLQNGQVISNINASLGLGGRLAGNVHRDTGEPLPFTHVELYWQPTNTGNLDWQESGIFTETDAAGNYTLQGIWPGTYRIAFNCEYGHQLVGYPCEYYGSKSEYIREATDVTVTAGQTTSGIDKTLGLEHPVFLPLVERP
jgi:hypothetical protein